MLRAVRKSSPMVFVLGAGVAMAAIPLTACSEEPRGERTAQSTAGAQMEPTKPAEPDGFVREGVGDVYGFYLPTTEVRAGNFVLDHIHMGIPSDFEALESGRMMHPSYAPFLMEFHDTTSPQGTNELGQTYYESTRRVLTTGYLISKDAVRFVGEDSVLGHVTFAGKLDTAALQAIVNSGAGSSDDAVMRGDIMIGDRAAENVAFTWFAGD